MNNRYHERLWQISIHDYPEVVCVCVVRAFVGPDDHGSIHFSLSRAVCVCAPSCASVAVRAATPCNLQAYPLQTSSPPTLATARSVMRVQRYVQTGGYNNE